MTQELMQNDKKKKVLQFYPWLKIQGGKNACLKMKKHNQML